MKKSPIAAIFHLFGDFWRREWAGEVNFGYNLPAGYGPYGNSTFVWAERCHVCGKVRIRYRDGLGYTRTPDVDKVILAAKGQIPYEVGTHSYHGPKNWDKNTPDT